mmetsp:Transcript_21393/g.49289  ORF Transcript_21393/g.49289 Transcript_21393/m.49289 type:complete len:294 (-) Transcript_21393:821-1702(-)
MCHHVRRRLALAVTFRQLQLRRHAHPRLAGPEHRFDNAYSALRRRRGCARDDGGRLPGRARRYRFEVFNGIICVGPPAPCQPRRGRPRRCTHVGQRRDLQPYHHGGGVVHNGEYRSTLRLRRAARPHHGRAADRCQPGGGQHCHRLRRDHYRRRAGLPVPWRAGRHGPSLHADHAAAAHDRRHGVEQDELAPPAPVGHVGFSGRAHVAARAKRDQLRRQLAGPVLLYNGHRGPRTVRDGARCAHRAGGGRARAHESRLAMGGGRRAGRPSGVQRRRVDGQGARAALGPAQPCK